MTKVYKNDTFMPHISSIKLPVSKPWLAKDLWVFDRYLKKRFKSIIDNRHAVNFIQIENKCLKIPLSKRFPHFKLNINNSMIRLSPFKRDRNCVCLLVLS